MSAMIFDLHSYRPESPTPAQQASERVADAIRHQVTSSILAQACARAGRHVAVWGRTVDDAVRMATAWALDPARTDPPTPPARAA